jgi:hypothetical protein
MKTPLFKQRSERFAYTNYAIIVTAASQITHEYSRQLAERERLAPNPTSCKMLILTWTTGTCTESMTSCRIHLFLYFISLASLYSCTLYTHAPHQDVVRLDRTRTSACISASRPRPQLALLARSPKNSCSRKARRLCRQTADVRQQDIC